MPKSPYNQPVFIVDKNASYIADVDSTGALKTSTTVGNVSVAQGNVNITDVNFSGTQTDNLGVSVVGGNVTVDSMPTVAVDINSTTDSILAYVNNATIAQMPTTTVAWNNATTTLTYDAQNNATEIIENRSDETKTIALGYDAQNNATQITETVS